MAKGKEGVSMNEVFEKIIKKLEELKKLYVDLQLSSKNNIEITAYAGKEQAIGIAIEYINEVAKEYVTDTNTGNNGWITCSERLPDVPEGTEDEDCPEFNVTIKGAKIATTLKCAPDGTWFDEYGNIYKVIAWQPLPEPYKKGE